MKNSAAGTDSASRLAKPSQPVTISERKRNANRQNAKKSTGPKTLSGKVYSRRNALKHGLFVRQITDFEALGEDPQEYEDLFNGFWDQYQPVGRAEEMEVERVAVCCWRLKRAWRYENAVSLAARRDFVRRELEEQEEYCKERDKEEDSVILELQSAKKEIADAGEISQELKQRIFAMMPGFEELWSGLEKTFQERVEELDLSKMFRKASPKTRSSLLAMYTVTNGIAFLEQLGRRRTIKRKGSCGWTTRHPEARSSGQVTSL